MDKRAWQILQRTETEDATLCFPLPGFQYLKKVLLFIPQVCTCHLLSYLELLLPSVHSFTCPPWLHNEVPPGCSSVCLQMDVDVNRLFQN